MFNKAGCLRKEVIRINHKTETFLIKRLTVGITKTSNQTECGNKFKISVKYC